MTGMYKRNASIMIIVIAVVFFSACDSGEKSSLINTQAAPSAISLPQPAQAQPAGVAAVQNAGAVSPSGPLNPAHGEPGHRCDIPVGAPLTQAAPTQVTANPQPVSLPQATAAAKPSGPLNPKHGEPGHRCDIPVGSPLNSPAAAASAPQPSVISQPAQQPSAVPLPTQLQLPQLNSGSGKTNPQHGQPGHRCDLPVGAALP